MAESSQAPEGWYQDPTDPGRDRYWSGTQWTESVRPSGVEGEEPAGEGDREAESGEPADTGAPEATGESAAPWRKRHPAALAWIVAVVALVVGAAIGGLAIGSVVASKKDETISSTRQELAQAKRAVAAAQATGASLAEGTEALGEMTVQMAAEVQRSAEARAKAKRQAAAARKQVAAAKKAAKTSEKETESAAQAALGFLVDLSSSAVKLEEEKKSLVLSGTGPQRIGRIVISRASSLEWETTGAFMILFDDGLSLALGGSGRSGEATLEPSVYRDVYALTDGRWQVTITRKD